MLKIKNIIRNITIAILLFLLPLVVCEVYLCCKFPFTKNIWPSKFISEVGWVFDPGSYVQWSNFLDFATRQKVNSIGFLDKEHDFDKPENAYRILILGDSFVEAAQVKIEDKFHVLLEKKLMAKYPSHRFEIIAMGYSGCGTSNELSFYEYFGARFDPDLVIIVFVNNDFANNSPILESVRNGWHPYHLPRLFFEKDSKSKKIQIINIDPLWQNHILKIDIKTVSSVLEKYLKWSRTYLWTSKVLGVKFNKGTNIYEKKYRSRINELRNSKEFRSQLEGWLYPDDLDFDQMFFAENMPEVFKNALDITDHVFNVFSDKAEKNDFELLVVASEGCSITPTSKNNRKMIERGYFLRLKEIAESYSIPIVELYEKFKKNRDINKAHFKHDGHWNETGHKWVAEALYQYLTKNTLFVNGPFPPDAQN